MRKKIGTSKIQKRLKTAWKKGFSAGERKAVKNTLITYSDVFRAWNAALTGHIIEGRIGNAFDSRAFSAFCRELTRISEKRRGLKS
jgi:hypothetical protein